MDHPPEIVALLEKYPSLRGPIETGVEVLFPLTLLIKKENCAQKENSENVAKLPLYFSLTMAAKSDCSLISSLTPIYMT